MNKEDIDFLMSIQSLPDEEFQIAYLERELEKKENIIKEVREYIEPLVELDNDIMLKGKMLKPVLEILDKEKDNE